MKIGAQSRPKNGVGSLNVEFVLYKELSDLNGNQQLLSFQKKDGTVKIIFDYHELSKRIRLKSSSLRTKKTRRATEIQKLSIRNIM